MRGRGDVSVARQLARSVGLKPDLQEPEADQRASGQTLKPSLLSGSERTR